MDGEENTQKSVNSYVATIYDLWKTAVSSKHVCGARHHKHSCTKQPSPTEPSQAMPHHTTPQVLLSLTFGGTESMVLPSKPSGSSPCATL